MSKHLKQLSVHEIWNLLSVGHCFHSKFSHLDPWFEGASRVCHSKTFYFLPITCAAQLLLDLRFQCVRIRRTSMQSETSGPGALTASDLSQNHEGAPPSDTKLDAEDTNVLAFEV